MPQFKYGNAQLAQQLGPDVVGQPLTDEIPFAGGNTIQLTTKGIMWYFAELPGKGIPGSYFDPFAEPGQ